jgi:hypothetical protein
LSAATRVTGDVPPFVEHCERSLPWLTLRGVGLANKDAVA